MTKPPHDLGVDPNDDQGMPNFEDHQEVGAERHALVGAPISPFATRGRIDIRYRMDFGDQISALIVEVGIIPAHYRDI